MRTAMLFIAAMLVTARAQVPDPTDTVAVTSAAPASASGLLYISKADTHAPGLRNPVLLVEGFDLANSMDWPELYNLLNRENLVAEIQSFGRDLLILNFDDSTIDISANAALNETAIAYVNDHRADPDDKFTVVGASLGGLTLRKALVDMPNHDVDTWISFDAPHEGANIPLGIQEYLEFFGPQNDSAAELLAVLDRPASRQMLLTHHSHPDGLAGGSIPERAAFVSLMEATGYPTNCKTIAISNGSGFGEKYAFSPGEQIIRWTDSGFFEPTVDSNIHALPTSPNTVFSGSIYFPFIIDESADVNAYHPLSFDNAPGGGRSTFLQLYTNIPPDQISGDDFCNYTNHCFIPTVSALGIPIENLHTNLAANAGILALSPFDEIHYAPANEGHVEINLNNKRWIMRAVLEGIDSDGDGWDDYQEYLLGSDYASAENALDIELTLALTNGAVEVAWLAQPNAQYDVWFTGDLLEPWVLTNTLAPTAIAHTNTYLSAKVATNGFFRVTGTVVDPISD